MKNSYKLPLFLLLLPALLAASCTEQSVQTDQAQENEPVLMATEVIESTATPADTAAPEPTMIPNTPTPDTRTPPDQWQNWPTVPQVTNRAREIYASGKLLGVNPRAFSKIGDCHNVSEAFLGIYDKQGRYFLRSDELEWQQTIDNFSGYFDRDGASFGQGLNVAAALSPLHADPDLCGPSEGPLQCELRTVKPSFAFVSFERWWSKETPPEVYEQYLRVIIEAVMDNGTVPILVTKADDMEGGHRINQIIANLAFEYDVPLLNWWRAAQFLPNKGMDPERDDGFHISYEAWDTRSYYALETLNNLWKNLEK